MAGDFIVPVRITAQDAARRIESNESVRSLTFSELGLKESHVEEFVRNNIDLLFLEPGEPSEETLLIVGQQPRNTEGGRADLVALDGDGDIILIEIKRDIPDMQGRTEPFEFQAIRYAASCARIRTPDELVRKLFEPYIFRHREEEPFKEELKNLNPAELASRKIKEFLTDNNANDQFNRRQKIILIASGFDAQTLSACAWLSSNGVDLRCLTVRPFKFGCRQAGPPGREDSHLFFQINQTIPPPTLMEYFLEIQEPGPRGRTARGSSGARFGRSRTTSLPTIGDLLEKGIVKKGDVLSIVGMKNVEGRVLDETNVKFNDEILSYNVWAAGQKKWSSINIYKYLVHRPTGMTLDYLRRNMPTEDTRDGSSLGDEQAQPAPDQ
jgi:hypothetical protein